MKEVLSAHNPLLYFFIEKAFALAYYGLARSTGPTVVKPPGLVLFVGQNEPKLWIQQTNSLAILDSPTLYNMVPYN